MPLQITRTLKKQGSSPYQSKNVLNLTHLLRTISDAPLEKTLKPPPPSLTTVLMDLRTELNVYTLNKNSADGLILAADKTLYLSSSSSLVNNKVC